MPFLYSGGRKSRGFGAVGRRLKRLAPLLAAPLPFLLGQDEAKAILTYNIFESGGNVVVQTSGSLNLAGATTGSPASCVDNGAVFSSIAQICTGALGTLPAYLISGPTNFSSAGGIIQFPASSVSGISAKLFGLASTFYLDSSYSSGAPIVSSATFNGKTLASFGFTQTSGVLGTWTLNGTSESIQVVLAAPASAVPGHLPLLGAGAAFGWSRKLRRRIGAVSSSNFEL